MLVEVYRRQYSRGESIMADILQENRLSLEDVCKGKIIPPARGGRRCHISTLVRWITIGAKAPDGRRVRLQAVRLGNRWVTSQAAIRRFCEALTPALESDAERPAPRTPGQRARADEVARQELIASDA
jgi:hypothetical protein